MHYWDDSNCFATTAGALMVIDTFCVVIAYPFSPICAYVSGTPDGIGLQSLVHSLCTIKLSNVWFLSNCSSCVLVSSYGWNDRRGKERGSNGTLLILVLRINWGRFHVRKFISKNLWRDYSVRLRTRSSKGRCTSKPQQPLRPRDVRGDNRWLGQLRFISFVITVR